MRTGRTSRSAIFVRAFLIVFLISIVLAESWNWAIDERFWSPVEIAVASLMIVVCFGGFGWLVVNVGTRLICGSDPEFGRYIRSGGDPYFDTLPSPLNPDSPLTRQTGLQEPAISKQAPRSWRYQCPVCGCRQPSRICVCWNCGYGADGDSTAYVERWGEHRPSDIAHDEWARLIGRRDGS